MGGTPVTRAARDSGGQKRGCFCWALGRWHETCPRGFSAFRPRVPAAERAARCRVLITYLLRTKSNIFRKGKWHFHQGTHSQKEVKDEQSQTHASRSGSLVLSLRPAFSGPGHHPGDTAWSCWRPCWCWFRSLGVAGRMEWFVLKASVLIGRGQGQGLIRKRAWKGLTRVRQGELLHQRAS